MIASYKHMFHRKIYLYIAMWLCLLPAVAFAASSANRDRIAVSPTRALSWECVVEAAETYSLPLAALVGILATEGGKTGEALSNTNGTWDMGAFQVNTCHVKELLRAGFSPDAVLRDGCANAYAAAWILRKEYDRTRNIWDAVGAYHSPTPARQTLYARAVNKRYLKLKGAL